MARSFKQRGTVVVPLAESPIPMVEVESIDNPAIFSETIAGEGNITGLTVYGKSTQDGTPSPENPVPIVSAGDGGSIGLTVSDGADQSQSLTISTPNGLPGIPVDSGGNYTDVSGQQWVCDEVDFAREIYAQRLFSTIGQNVLSFSDSANRRQVSFALPYQGKNTIGLSNRFVYKDFQSPGYFSVDRITPVIYVRFELSTSLEQINQILQNSIFIYELATPIETPLSEEEIAAYRALHTYDGTTVISVNSDPIVPGLKSTVKIIDPNSGNPQIMQLWLDKEGHPVNINGRGARVGGTPTQQYILQPCSF